MRYKKVGKAMSLPDLAVSNSMEDNRYRLNGALMTKFEPQGTSCPFCSSTRLRSFRVQANDSQSEPRRVNICECRDCHLAWQWPQQRTNTESIAYFDKQYGANQSSESYYNREGKSAIATLQLEFVELFSAKPGTLLDIGSGSGEFLDVASSHGWKAFGVEPSPIGRTKTQEFGAGYIVYKDLDQVPASQKVDVVTMWDVVEHVDYPLDLIAKARAKLKKHGWLFIETGNYESIERIQDGTQWWCYQLDHRWYLSPAIMQALLRHVGFNRLILSNRVLRPGYIRATNVKPSLVRHVKHTLLHPHHILAIWKRYFEHNEVIEKWPESAPIPIFAVAATATESA